MFLDVVGDQGVAQIAVAVTGILTVVKTTDRSYLCSTAASGIALPLIKTGR